jgi:peptide/nickel transport system ATP-binding protein/oligopeptide transport system ATP-binding protein
MSAVPVPDPRLAKAKKRQILAGDVPSPSNPPPACPFHTRCWKAEEICATQEPPLEGKPKSAAGHAAACHFAWRAAPAPHRPEVELETP